MNYFCLVLVISIQILTLTNCEVNTKNEENDCLVNTIKELLFPSNPDNCEDVVSSNPRPVVKLSSGLEVMCDTQTEGGGWTIIQRRTNGQLDFNKTWEEYKNGFGDVNVGEFWLGNENIHQLTTLQRYQFRVDLKFNNNDYFAQYSIFRVYREEENYRLELDGYSGNAGDSMFEMHNKQQFSTFDKDNDRTSTLNCGKLFSAGWWFSDCFTANLNGKWGSQAPNGVNWLFTTGAKNSATFTEMKIRPT